MNSSTELRCFQKPEKRGSEKRFSLVGVPQGNAKCLCHLWTAKRANLGFSLIATVTSLLRLRWGWVEGMAGGGLEDGRMEG
ncbi:hypothetical protein EYF80_000130 [Liparis tanakae]|uniref:Uncharacterized protein n=1 Tax=Liparis tanakae TaxID=230148 RepID=A0A4Z2JHT6_9TELE|nr:hypothetical protein EYF80_000130 [Liparis tanakae]